MLQNGGKDTAGAGWGGNPELGGGSPAAGDALATDLYQLAMAQAYLAEGLTGHAVFELVVRRLPPRRNYLVACGLDAALAYLEELRFTAHDLAYLAALGRFSPALLRWLRELRFTGDVRAVREGTPVFAGEPLLEVAAPLPQAQLVETFLMNQVHFATLIASKAARIVTAARGRPVADFGQRRMPGRDAAVTGARACRVAGVASTSNVLAGRLHGIPVSGTMAHSYVQAHPTEAEAFRAFAAEHPGTTLLVDTYDTVEGVREVARLARELGEAFGVRAVRLDSGDLDALSRAARAVLDAVGLGGV